jgi:hypothetical protein
MGEIRLKALRGRRVMDAVFDPTEWGRVLIVDESGGVWIWRWDRTIGGAKGASEMSL